MKFEFPDTGEGVTKGKFLDWKINEGDAVEEDQVVGEAETDKAVVEIPSPADGTIEKLLVEPGDNVEVGEVIMELETGEKEIEDADKETEPSKEKEETNGKTSSADYSSSDVVALPKVRKKAEEKGINLEDLDIDGRVHMKDLEDVSEKSGAEKDSENIQEKSGDVSTPKNVKATPSVRKLARKKGIDISKAEGSGRGGKITREDIQNFNEGKSREHELENTPNEEDSSASGEELSGLEKNVARKMSKSRFSAPHVTHVEKVDVTDLVNLREQANSEVDPHLTYMPFIMKASMLAMNYYPRTNAHFNGDKMEIDLKENFDFNIAVDSERGLLVPRIDNVGEKSLLELAKDLGELVENAQKSELDNKQMSPGSFSITNLGVIGGEEFTPIINPPQTCILGVGKIQETAEVVDGEVVPRMTMKLSFSYDHRVIDGATAARFVNEIKENLENPEEMMVSL